MADLTQKREKSGKPNKQPVVTWRRGRNLIQLIECRKSVRLLLRLPKKPRKHDAPFLFKSASSRTLTIAIPPLLLQAAIPKVLYRNQIPFLKQQHWMPQKHWQDLVDLCFQKLQKRQQTEADSANGKNWVQNTKKKKKKKKKGLQNHTPKKLTEGGITDERKRTKTAAKKENSKPPRIVKKQRSRTQTEPLMCGNNNKRYDANSASETQAWYKSWGTESEEIRGLTRGNHRHVLWSKAEKEGKDGNSRRRRRKKKKERRRTQGSEAEQPRVWTEQSVSRGPRCQQQHQKQRKKEKRKETKRKECVRQPCPPGYHPGYLIACTRRTLIDFLLHEHW